MMFRGLAYVPKYYCIHIFFICNGCIENCAGKIIFVKKAQKHIDKTTKRHCMTKENPIFTSLYEMQRYHY